LRSQLGVFGLCQRAIIAYDIFAARNLRVRRIVNQQN